MLQEIALMYMIPPPARGCKEDLRSPDDQIPTPIYNTSITRPRVLRSRYGMPLELLVFIMNFRQVAGKTVDKSPSGLTIQCKTAQL